ncbi:notchless protein homolog 1 [Folsomia candida]|uniref:Notchless protein 1 n=1 Tax=Folsomia candida TaxID=158441 RepID=A0A226EJ36_FOLCA|nr:notchless protein homolog 1 [Folsomia candida]OXA57705.1 Notchless protein 1 [Folsomia candida]
MGEFSSNGIMGATDEKMVDTRQVSIMIAVEEQALVMGPIDVPVTVTLDQIKQMAEGLGMDGDPFMSVYFVNNKEITSSLSGVLTNEEKDDHETVFKIICQPQAVFKVRCITRCTSSLSGHAKEVLSANFSGDGRKLATGSGDSSVRFWDLDTETPEYTCEGHGDWVLAVAWAPSGLRVASASKNGKILIWDPSSGKQMGKPLMGHKDYVSFLCWEPLHLNGECRHLASCSKDQTIRIWDVVLGNTVRILTGHTAGITCIRWGGSGLIYSACRDRTIKVWRASDGVLCRTLEGHGHWVTTLALSSDYVMRTGAFDPKDVEILAYKELPKLGHGEYQEMAKSRYDAFMANRGPEVLVAGSDDFTLSMWHPTEDNKIKKKMTGHCQTVNDVKFSPDGRLLASASFDKSIKLWDGKTGDFITTLRGHVQCVFQIAWSADSRFLVSGSKDSTVKVWSMKTKKLEVDLPGHADEVYAVDWSPDGQRVVSGGKDKVLKIWRH